MNRRHELGLFLVSSILICLAIFQGAFWGSRILAPVDIAPTIFSKYRYVDPLAGHVPANHYIIDQLTFDLPLQYTIYNAYRHGEIPWWDPYTYGGRPLLADAHVNGTDPIRVLCYLTLPFVSAYNWNLILKSILTGLGMLLLLRHLRFELSISLSLALTYQFAGCFAVFFGHPWIQASFAYYPFLWSAWSIGIQRHFWRYSVIGAGLAALIFYCGNLQSHAYLPIFGLCFLVGHGSLDKTLWPRASGMILFSGIIGAALAAPVLFAQIEDYLNSIRTASFSPSSAWSYLVGIMSLSAVFPWTLGTFRTFDVSKLAGFEAVGFLMFIGSAAFLLALLGCVKANVLQADQQGTKRTAITLVIVYLLVCSCPLLPILYTRMAPLGVMGLIVLAAFGLSALRNSARPALGVAWTIAGGAVAIVLTLNLMAFVIYPKIIDRVRTLVAAREQTNTRFDQTPSLREFQIESLPREISLLNVETSFAFLSLLGLAFYFVRRPSTPMQYLLLTLNFLPVIFFFSRFVPNQPVIYWERLLAGGPEQRRVADLLNPGHQRLLEESPGLNDMLFPNNMGHLQKIHTVYGLSALQPASIFQWPLKEKPSPELVADYVYRSDRRGAEAGELAKVTNRGTSRLHATQRRVSILDETLNDLRVSIEPGPADTLLRTDTLYPGWRAELNGERVPLRQEDATPFSIIELPASDAASVVTYHYRLLR